MTERLAQAKESEYPLSYIYNDFQGSILTKPEIDFVVEHTNAQAVLEYDVACCDCTVYALYSGNGRVNEDYNWTWYTVKPEANDD